MDRLETGHINAPAMAQRCGDSIEIGGDYQHRAVTKGNPVQRFWHSSKTLAIEKLLPPRPGDKVMDVGCGSGVISSFLGHCGAQVVGVDANPDAVRFADATYSSEKVSFRLGLADQPLGQEASFDKIYCLELIEHIHAFQSRAMLDGFFSLLKPGGGVLLSTPNYHSLWPAIEWLMDHTGLAPHMAGHQHVERYHRRKLRALCLASGFTLEHLGTMCFLAPWLAPLSWRGARMLTRLELATTVIPGSILVCVLSKRG
ncbi:MAG: class I SAM-dependent methyltransferase [Phycisphaerales bacterium]